MASATRPVLRHPWDLTPLLLLPAGFSMFVGIDAGLLLGDLPAPLDRADLSARHGILMVVGFLGTLISLERSVALRQAWGYSAPALLGAGALFLALGGQPHHRQVGAVLLVNGCLIALAVYLALSTRQRDEATAVGALGAAAALTAVILWLRLEVYDLVPWLATFIILTIASERLELARLHRPAGMGRILLILAMSVFLAAGLTLLAPAIGWHLFGLAVLVLTAWTASGDVASHTIRSKGLPRFAAAAMLLGYAWLVSAALLWTLGGAPASRAEYDFVVHAAFLGFAMSMVLAHAPVILPAIIRRPLPYHPAMWALLSLLQVGLVARLVAGDLLSSLPAYRAGLWLTAAALVLLPIMSATLVVRASRRTRPRPAQLSPQPGEPALRS